jgi:hypothetical protein
VRGAALDEVLGVVINIVPETAIETVLNTTNYGAKDVLTMFGDENAAPAVLPNAISALVRSRRNRRVWRRTDTSFLSDEVKSSSSGHMSLALEA